MALGKSGSGVFQLAPVVLDLNGDGVDLVSLAASTVFFDVDGDGVKDRTGWAGSNDGFLVYDANGNGIVDNGSEISFQRFVAGAASDLEGLAFFDSDRNRQLDADDASFTRFFVWRDANQNGITDAGELVSLSAAGISAISLSGSRTDVANPGTENVIFATADFTRSDGTTGQTGDVFVAFEKANAASDTGFDTVTTQTASSSPATTTARHDYDGKSKKFRVQSQNGNLFVIPKQGGGLLDPRAGQFGPATILAFKNKSVGYLTAIVLDLDGNGLDIKDRTKSSASFDLDGDGIADDTGWLSKRDALLVIDRNGDGTITSASELSFLTERSDLTNSFSGLALLDANRDGRIDRNDARFSELRVWVDANSDGISSASELRTLADVGITEIGLSNQPNNQSAKVGKNLILSTATFRRNDGTTGTVGDVALAFNPTLAKASATPLSATQSFGEAQLAGIRDALSADVGVAAADSASQRAFDPDASKIAQMIQAMASFVGSQGAIETRLNAPDGVSGYALYAGS